MQNSVYDKITSNLAELSSKLDDDYAEGVRLLRLAFEHIGSDGLNLAERIALRFSEAGRQQRVYDLIEFITNHAPPLDDQETILENILTGIKLASAHPGRDDASPLPGGLSMFKIQNWEFFSRELRARMGRAAVQFELLAMIDDRDLSWKIGDIQVLVSFRPEKFTPEVELWHKANF